MLLCPKTVNSSVKLCSGTQTCLCVQLGHNSAVPPQQICWLHAVVAILLEHLSQSARQVCWEQ